MGIVKKSVDERTRHQRQYDRRKAVRQNQKCKMKAASQEMIHMLMMHTPIYDKEPMAEAKLLTENEHLNKEKEHLKQTYKDLYDSIKKKRVQTKDHNDSLIVQLNNKSTENADLKAQLQEKVFAIIALKNELRKLKGNNVDTKFAKPSVLGKPILQPLRHQSVVRQPNAFKSKRPKISKPRFAFQVDVKNDLSKPVTQHLPKGRESNFSKHNHVIASSESRNSSKNMPRFS
ncbi:hypothetical protein Tco_0424409 [Tanacetum coccineum]